ncbi:class I SAM-dependent methyltransferase [Microbacterium aerolatum]|uniref:class I SAM-dependent methyltransferase n=1 Tax=Microbacterium aerolatum TaxID=153731 RepID=UPI002000BA68|nr:class I SAM-dependent methyltransferase [Microbacterium aerolatum]MCK3771062.1 class I SAM-dependent methyltransferase [Microbacterium aerolatum]
MVVSRVGAAYAKRAGEYIDALGFIEATAEQDRKLIGAWAEDVPGLILDVGCGPGHWTAWLHQRGHNVEGVDPVPAFIDHATATYPGVPFRVGQAEHLHVADASLGGILAWYSLIHTDPARVPAVLGGFARALTPDGSLALGFFDGPVVAAFDHTVTTAYFWPIDTLAERVEEAGFTVTLRHTRSEPGARPHGAIIARRTRSAPD